MIELCNVKHRKRTQMLLSLSLAMNKLYTLYVRLGQLSNSHVGYITAVHSQRESCVRPWPNILSPSVPEVQQLS